MSGDRWIRRPSDRPIEQTGQTIEVPVHEERVEVEKQPVVYEEVGIGKRSVTETQSVSETLRREEARIDREGGVDVRGWSDEMRSRPEYRGRSFNDVEQNMRSDWERRYPIAVGSCTRKHPRDLGRDDLVNA